MDEKCKKTEKKGNTEEIKKFYSVMTNAVIMLFLIFNLYIGGIIIV